MKVSRKVTNIILVLIILVQMSSISAYALTTELGAASFPGYYNVYLEGQTKIPLDTITVILTDKASGQKIGYIEQTTTNENGEYKFKFILRDNIENYNIFIREDGSKSDITDSLQTGIAQKELYPVTLKVTADGGERAYVDEDGFLDVYANIKNKYANDSEFCVVIAAYGENNELIDIKSDTVSFEFDDMDVWKESVLNYELPYGTAYVKAYGWTDFENLIPVAESETEKVQSTVFDDDGFTEENPKTIGIIGDSITHHSYYLTFLEHYYDTRYPEKNIKFLNKGISGDTSTGVYGRLQWDVFNENSDFFNSCDEITVMIGMNDVGYSSYPSDRMTDINWKQDETKLSKINKSVSNIETIIQYCKEENKPVTLVTPSLYDESDMFTAREDIGDHFGTNWALGMVAEGIRDLAEKYDVPYLDLYRLSNEYSEKIRTATNSEMVITGNDRIHPNDHGGYLLGYLFIKAQDNNKLVAEVSIDVNNASCSAKNAQINEEVITENSISYNYLPASLPLAVGNQYRYVRDNFKINLGEEINNEIVRVTGLEDGTYTLKIDGNTLGTYMASEFADGINIAENENNPGQIQAQESFLHLVNKLRNTTDGETQIRYIALEEQKLYLALGLDKAEKYSNEQWLAFAEQAGFTDAANHKYLTNKAKEAEIWENFNQRYEAERAAAKPQVHKVTITKQ